MSQHNFGEIPEDPLTLETEAKFMPLINRIQMALIQDYMIENGVTGDSSSPEGIEITQKWSRLYSGRDGKFRKIFHRMIVANPHLKEDLQMIPDALYEEIKRELYHDDVHVNPEDYVDVGDTEGKRAA